MHKTIIAALVAAVLVGTLPPMASGSPRAMVSQDVARGFFKTVFGLEHGSHADAQKVKRFATKVRFHVSDRSGRGRLAAARTFLKTLGQRIQHFHSVEVAHARDANFRILIVRKADFGAVVARELKADTIAMGARCLVGVTTKNGRIEHSLAIIVGDDDYLFRRCLVEEVLQGLGPMNDDDQLPESVFNDSSHHTEFTSFDEAILNLLYHPAIEPGMTGSQAHQALPRALFDLGYAQ